MKQGKHFFYMAAMLLATLTGCQEIEGTDITGNAAVNDEVELVASIDDAATRTLLSESNQVMWVKNDKLAIFYGYDSPSEFTLKKGEGTTQGTFRTPNVSTAGKSIGDAVVAIYPYIANAKLTYNDEEGTYSVKTRFPAEQHYSSNSFGSGAAPMMAISEKGSDLSFKNVGATIKMRVKSQVEGAVINKIVAYTTERDGQRRKLAGEAIYTMKADGIPTVELVDNENAASEIVLICDGGVELSTTEVTEFYFSLPPMVGENEFEANELVFELFENDRVSCTIFKEVAFGCDRSVITTIGEEEGYTYVPVEKEVDEAPYVTFASENVQTLSTVAYDYSTRPWTKKNVPVEGLEYSVGDGDWQALGESEAEFGGANGDLRLRGKCANGTGNNARDYVMISLSGSDVTCSGDIRTLIDYENYETTSTANACFYGLFKECTALTDASGLQFISNNNEMAEACYSSMFSGCTSLVSAPALPATTLADGCYSSMFSDCTSMANVPELPATTLADYCYNYMFSGCTSLVNAPELPATNLAESCYGSMFEDCTSLENAPVLPPATTLADYCYESMFSGCTSLENAPVLPPATTLADGCYSSMFSRCTSLVYAPALPAETLANYCYYYMFSGCTSLVYAPALSAETLAIRCYSSMFEDCTSLADAPELPATTLADYCYDYMFSGCTSLVSAPALPAETLAENCYSSMFNGCTSLVSAPALSAETLAIRCYSSMFSGCTSLVSAPALPAETLANNCYDSMFSGCTSLESAPALPAETLADYCYYSMFSGCTSLESAPALPAETLANYCYYYMFSGCTSLESAPALPATNLAQGCYNSMFAECSNLVSAPALPATTLQKSCYGYMFRDCTKLTASPVLPALTLVDYCYKEMFERCTNLSTITMLATDIKAVDCLSLWVYKVASTGTFYRNSNATWEKIGTNGIPSGWTFLPYSE